MFFLFQRASTGEIFAIGGGVYEIVTAAQDLQRARDTPGILNNGAIQINVSDYGTKFYLRLFQVPTDQWPVGITP